MHIVMVVLTTAQQTPVAYSSPRKGALSRSQSMIRFAHFVSIPMTARVPVNESLPFIDTQCPIPGCTKAKFQFLDASNDSAPASKYLRYEFCPDRKPPSFQIARPRFLTSNDNRQVRGSEMPSATGCASTTGTNSRWTTVEVPHSLSTT